MKKIMGKVKQTLSILLAIAMVVTCIPQTGLSVQAAAESDDIIAAAETQDIDEDTDVDVEMPEDLADVPDADDTSEDDALPVEETVSGMEENEGTEGSEEPIEEIVGAELGEEAPAMTNEGNSGDACTVTITHDKNVYEVWDIKINDVAADPKEYSGEDSWTIPAKEGDKLSFRLLVSPTNFRETVTVGEEKLPAEDGVYTIDSLAGDTEITVTTEFAYYGLKARLYDGEEEFKYAEGSATIAFFQNDKEIEVDVELEGPTVELERNDDVTIIVTPAEGYVVTSVKAGSISLTPELKDSDGRLVYRASFTQDNPYNLMIVVTTQKKKSVTVNFASHQNVAKVNDIKVNTETKADLNDTNGWTLSAYTGDTVNFKLTAAAPYKVKKVTVNDTEVKPDATGMYEIGALEADTNVAIETELDPKQCYKLTVNLNGNADSATLSVYEDDKLVAEEFGKEVLFKFTTPAKANVKIVVNANENYEVTCVKKGSSSLNLNTIKDDDGNITESYYSVPFTAKTTVVEVTTGYKATTEEKEVTIWQLGAHQMLGVVKADKNILEWVCDEYFEVPAGTKEFKFNVVATGAYRPVVTRGSEDGTVISADKSTSKTVKGVKQTTYEYSIPADALGTVENIYVTEEENNHTVTLTGATGEVDLVVSVDGKIYTKQPDNTRTVITKYEVPDDTVITVKATENRDNGSYLTALGYTMGTQKKSVNPSKGTVAVEIKATDDVTIDIQTAPLYKTELTGSDSKEFELNKDTYNNVSYAGTYTLSVKSGCGWQSTDLKMVTLTGKTAQNQNGNITWTKSSTANDVFRVAGGSITFTDLSKYAGQTLTLQMYDSTDKTAKPVVTRKLQITQPLTSIKVNGKATGTLTITQTADTVKAYPITVNSTNKLGELSRLSSEEYTVLVKDAEGNDITNSDDAAVNAVIDGTNLKVTTGQAAKNTQATVSIVKQGSGDTTTELYSLMVKLGDYPVTANTPAPTVTLVKADDISLTIQATSKNIETLNTGKLYYYVQADAVADSKKTPNKPTKLQESYKLYWSLEDGNVINLKLANSGVNFGAGEGWKYNVKVNLVYAKNDTEPTEENNSTVIAESGKPAAKTFSTLAPRYETKLTLKNGTTTVYTGQSDVPVATVQFSKNTTYTNLKEDWAWDTTGDLGVRVEWNDEKGEYRILASANADTKPGKHTIEVGADDGGESTNILSAIAKIDVTVVKGINDLSVSVPSYSIYKQNKKQATLKATPIYNGDITGKNKDLQPKTKKVKWDFVKSVEYNDDGTVKSTTEFTQGDPLYGYIKSGTVKIAANGTVTIGKDYILSEDAANNTFVIRAIADDLTTDKAVGYSMPITITEKGIAIQTLALVKKITEGANAGRYKLLAMPYSMKNQSIGGSPSDFDGAKLIAYPSGSTMLQYELEHGDRLIEMTVGEAALWEIIPDTNISFKSSNTKNVTIDKDGTIKVIKPWSNAKLTVVANDGSNAKAELGISIAYDVTKELSLDIAQVTDYDGNLDISAISGVPLEKNADGKYEYSGSPVFLATVKNGNDDASGFEYYTVKVDTKTAKELARSGNQILFAATKQDAVITLTDNGNSNKNTNTISYTLYNTNLKTGSKDPKVGAKAANSFYEYAKASEQKVELQLTEADVKKLLNENTTADDLRVSVEIDWSKQTAKNAEALRELAGIINPISLSSGLKPELKEVAKNKSAYVVSVKADTTNGDGFVKLTTGAYALKITVGTEADGKFEALTQPTAVTVKVDKNKAFTFALKSTSYTIQLKDTDRAVIVPKVNDPKAKYTVKYSLYTDHTATGQPNEFMNLFDYDKETNDIEANAIVLQDGADLSKLSFDKNGKAKITGYLEYRVDLESGYYSNSYGYGGENYGWTVRNAVKVTVTIDAKKSLQYSVASPIEIDAAQGAETTAAVTTGTGNNATPVKVAYAAADADVTNWAISVDEEGRISFKNNTALTKDTAYPITKGKLYILPDDSYYANKLKKTPLEGDELTTYVKEHGIAINNAVTIKAVEQPKTDPETPEVTE